MRPAIAAEKAGIPSVVVAATSFLTLVQQLGTAEGLRNLRAAEYPGAFAIDAEAMMRQKFAEKTLGRIVEALTKPVERSGGGTTVASKPEKVVFTGNLEEVNQHFHNNKWSDGLAIIPPTVDRIEEFLKYTDRSPHEEIAILPPGNLRATTWIIAANGVMAGCRPEHMPVLIAAVEAIADPEYNLEQINTTGGLNPFLLVNGPIIKQLGFEYGTALASRGPNPVIGRALGLIIRNIAGLRPAEQNMGTFGYILPFVLAEDEEGCPWEPFHVQHGFDRNTSTVTAAGTHNWGFQEFPAGTEIEGYLKIICRHIVNITSPMTSTKHGHVQMLTVVMTPSVAKAIAQGGYSRKDVEEYLFKNATLTIGEINFILKYGDSGGRGTTIRYLIEQGRDTPKEWANLRPDDRVPVMAFPGLIHVVVCGDPTRNKVMALYGVYNHPATKEIKLPAKWGQLTAKLKK